MLAKSEPQPPITPHHALDERFMGRALALAAEAAILGEIPVGAVVVHFPLGGEPEIVAEARNCKELAQDPLGHAEILAIRAAASELGRWRLSRCALYSTLEPCAMCAGAIVHARLDRVVYGAADAKAGAVDSLFHILRDPRLNHSPEVKGRVREDECAGALRAFFRELRARKP
jgi:tRNA(adenine34) deaminase